MDFIIKLLKTKDSTTRIVYKLIMVVISKLIKYVYFISFNKISNVKQLKLFFIN